MYSDGTYEFEREASLFVATHDKPREMERRYLKLCQSRLESDWMKALFYGFGPYSMSDSFEYFSNFLKSSYVSEKYDSLDLDICAESSKLILVRYTLQLLLNICKQADANNAMESEYMVVKFFMLACLSREDQLKTTVMQKTHGGNINGSQTAHLVDFFSFIKRDFEYITQCSFNEFSIIKMMTDFIARSVLKYEGLLLDDKMERSDDARGASIISNNVSLSTSVSFTPPPLRRDALKRADEDIVIDDDGRQRLSLPELYDPKYGSAQTAALAERTAAISYYALISILVNFYANAYYGVRLPPSLYHVVAKPRDHR